MQETKMNTILIIDDNSDFRETLRDILKKKGYRILEASDGSDGIRIFRENTVDLIITDIIMPGKEGIETIIELRNEFPDIKIIAVSGGGRNTPDAYLPLAKDFGVKYTFPKPLEINKLLEAVDHLLQV